MKIGKKCVFEILQEVYNYFYEIFVEPNRDIHCLDDVTFRSLSDEDNIGLTGLFLIHELEQVVTH